MAMPTPARNVPAYSTQVVSPQSRRPTPANTVSTASCTPVAAPWRRASRCAARGEQPHAQDRQGGQGAHRGVAQVQVGDDGRRAAAARWTWRPAGWRRRRGARGRAGAPVAARSRGRRCAAGLGRWSSSSILAPGPTPACADPRRCPAPRRPDGSDAAYGQRPVVRVEPESCASGGREPASWSSTCRGTGVVVVQGRGGRHPRPRLVVRQPGQHQQVDDRRADLGAHDLGRERGVGAGGPGALAPDRGQRVAGADRQPPLLELGGDVVGDVGQVGDQRRRTRAAPARRSRWPRWPGAPGPGCCGWPGPAARAGRRWPARRAGAGGGTVRGARPRCPRRTATAARPGRARSPGPAAASSRASTSSRWRSARAVSCRTAAMSATTGAACARGLRRGEAGTMVAASRATAPPTTASSQRPSAAPGWATSVVMITACTPAWVVIRMPAPSSAAMLIDAIATTATCQTPDPNSCTNRSPMNTPMATPMTTSVTRRSRCPNDRPRATIAATGAKNGCGWPRRSLRDPPGDRRRRGRTAR